MKSIPRQCHSSSPMILTLMLPDFIDQESNIAHMPNMLLDVVDHTDRVCHLTFIMWLITSNEQLAKYRFKINRYVIPWAQIFSSWEVYHTNQFSSSFSLPLVWNDFHSKSRCYKVEGKGMKALGHSDKSCLHSSKLALKYKVVRASECDSFRENHSMICLLIQFTKAVIISDCAEAYHSVR